MVAHGDGKFELTLPSGRKMTIYVRVSSLPVLVLLLIDLPVITIIRYSAIASW